jgi:hypothetical protein
MNKHNHEEQVQSVIVNGFEITPDLIKTLREISEDRDFYRRVLTNSVFDLIQMEDSEYIDKNFFYVIRSFINILNSIDQKGGHPNDR